MEALADFNKRTLKQRVLLASTWAIVGFVVAQAIRLGSSLITTRLLVPKMFGVLAIAQIMMFGLALFSDFGLNQSVVQSRRGNDAAYFNTAWVTQILRGMVIAVLALLLSLILAYSSFVQHFLAGSVYADPQLPLVIMAISFTAIISGFESSKLALASRNLALGRVTQIEIFCQIVGLVCIISWALVSPSIWALVAGGLISSLARTVLSHFSLPGPRNRFEWSPQAFREILSFGKWVILSSILWFLVSSGDRLLLGGLVSPETLGLYATAFLLVNAFQQALAKLAGSIALPVLSEVMRERPHHLRTTYYRVRLPIDLAALFSSGLLFVLGSLVTRILYDQRYLGAGHMLEVLAITLVMTRYFVTDQCFVAIGEPRLLALLNLIRTLALYLLVPAGYFLYGVNGALWAIVLSGFAAAPLMFYFICRLELLDLKRELIVLPMFFVGILSGKILIALASTYFPALG